MFDHAKNRSRKNRKLEKKAIELIKQEQQCNLRALIHNHNYDTKSREEFVIEERPKFLCTTVASASEDVHLIPVEVGSWLCSVCHIILWLYNRMSN